MGSWTQVLLCREGSKPVLAFPVMRCGDFRGPGAKLSISPRLSSFARPQRHMGQRVMFRKNCRMFFGTTGCP